jgi:hypothetical protein
LRSGVVGLGVSARLARFPARLMMIAMTVAAERSQTVTYGAVMVVRVIVAAAKRLAWLTALGEMRIYSGRGGQLVRRSGRSDTATIDRAIEAVRRRPSLAR